MDRFFCRCLQIVHVTSEKRIELHRLWICMKIIAISDTHIKFGSIKDHLPDDLIEMMKRADIIIHAGDFVRKKAYDEICMLNRLEAVHGDMDFAELRKALPERNVIEIE